MLHNRARTGFSRSLVIGVATLLTVTPLPDNLSAQQSRSRSGEPAARSEKSANSGPIGQFSVRVADILEQPLRARVRLLNEQGAVITRFEIPNGNANLEFRPGRYTALVDVYDGGVPILVHIQQIELPSSPEPAISVSLLEGSASRNLARFDGDLDLALDRLELEQNSDPEDARSTPGEAVFDWPSPVLSEDSGWYRGELHAYSNHGPGSESVDRLIRRAEAAGLDFLAITDPNSIQSAFDPGYKSSKLVLIPAMEWGTPETGTALIYAPSELLPSDVSREEAQALALRLQARGGLFVIAHPAAPDGTWNWGLNFFNGVEVWWKDWRQVPPIQLSHLSEPWRERDESGNFKYAMAAAAATRGLSANGQSTIFYDMQTTHLAKAAVIAGTGSTGRKETLGSPVTYIYGREKSLKGILEGIRKGRTYVSRGVDGPVIEFQADILADGQIDVGMGGIVPINVTSRFVAGVSGAKGARMDILMNGYPVRSLQIESDKLTMSLEQTPDAFGAFRMRIVAAPKDQQGYGFTEMLAMSSPIYAQSYFVEGGTQAGRDGWVEVESNYQEPRPGDLIDPTKLDPSRVVTLDPK